MNKSKRTTVTLTPELKACVEQDAKNLAISEASVIRMRLKERYDRLLIPRGEQEPAPSPAGAPQPQL
jgi:hypothetical protein